MRQKLKILTGLVTSTVLLTGCVSVLSLNPGTEKVIISNDRSIKNCHYMGKVTVINESYHMTTPSQHNWLKAVEFDQLKNQALKLNANRIVLSANSRMTDEKHTASRDTHSKIATHVFQGKDFQCPH